MQLAQRLVKNGALAAADLPRVNEAIAAAQGRPAHEVLIDRGFAKEDAVLAALGEEFGLDVVDLTITTVPPEVLATIPQKLVHRRNLMPISRDNGTLVVATGNPYDLSSLDEVQTVTGMHIVPVLASPRELTRLIKTYYGVGGDTVTAMVLERGEEAVELLEGIEADDSEMAKEAQEASVVRLVNQILVEAANERASDIHIEPEEKSLRIRYRVDGILQTQMLPPEITRFQAAIISRIKIMSHLNIAEKRLPQDGRIKIRLDAAEVDIRVSVIPMLHGEAVVMRLLRQNSALRGMGQMGMDERELVSFRRVLGLPHGIVLVTGPTGSGKTSTLNTALAEINDAVR